MNASDMHRKAMQDIEKILDECREIREDLKRKQREDDQTLDTIDQRLQLLESSMSDA